MGRGRMNRSVPRSPQNRVVFPLTPPPKLTSSAEQLPRVVVASTFLWALSMAKVRTAWASWGGEEGGQ